MLSSERTLTFKRHGIDLETEIEVDSEVKSGGGIVEHGLEAVNNQTGAGDSGRCSCDLYMALGLRKNRHLGLEKMSEEAEEWGRKPKRMIHNQSLIQLLLILAFTVPLPTVGVVFWLVFVVSPTIAIPCIIVTWTTSATAYAALAVYTRIKGKHS
jgi:hypothetical protein